jgi:hypothetical protein
VTRFHDGDFFPGHAPGKNKNEADRSRATKTGQLDELATSREAGLDRMPRNALAERQHRYENDKSAAAADKERPAKVAVSEHCSARFRTASYGIVRRITVVLR